MRLILVVVALTMAFLANAVTASAQTPNRLTCEGYAEKRQFVDAQSWWLTTPGKSGTDFGHSHVGACIPERETVSGTVPLDVRMMLHDNPGEFSTLRITVKGDDYEKNVFEHDYEEDCLEMTCVKWQHFDVPVSAFSHSGLQEIRLRLTVEEPDGNTQKPSMGFKVYVENGKSREDYPRNPWVRGKGWYSDNGYCEADLVGAIPDAPVSGIYSPTVRFRDHGSSDDRPVARHEVRVDPDFHAGPLNGGLLLKSALGQFEGPFTVDTTRLSNGQHRLFLRSECDTDVGSTLSGILVFPFTVSN